MGRNQRQIHIGISLDESALPSASSAHRSAFVQLAEQGKLDFVSLTGKKDSLGLMAAWSTITESIGLVVTSPSAFHEPYHIARKLSSLDHLSNGRAAWEVPVALNEAYAKHFAHVPNRTSAEQYERAGELLKVVKGLWDGWEDDALTADKRTGVFANGEHIHELNHVGSWFKVRGAINLPRPLQGYPVIVHELEDHSESLQFAAAHANVVVINERQAEEGSKRYTEIKDLAAAQGRSTTDVVVLQRTEVLGDISALESALIRAIKSQRADGFIFHLQDTSQLAPLVHRLIPRLQQLGVFRECYTSNTLRGHLGLSRLEHPQYVQR